MNTYAPVLSAVILTALPVEYQAVRAHLHNPQEEIHPEGTIYERGVFLSHKQSWEIGLVETRMGAARAAFEAERAIDYFKPNVILFVGIAGGLKAVTIGDIVVATKIYGYESGKAETSFLTRPEVGISTYRMIQRAQAVARNTSWLRRIQPNPPPLPPKAFIAALAAGEKVVASTLSDTWKLLRQSYEDAIAVEMEGYGFLQAVHGNQRVEALVVRGISDLVEGKSEADAAGMQEIAANHASAFAFEVLAQLTAEELAIPPTINASSSSSKKPHREGSISQPQIHQTTRSGDIIAPIGDHHHITIHRTSSDHKEDEP